MTVRDTLIAALRAWADRHDGEIAPEAPEQMADAYRAEVLAEAKTETVAWLIKKATDQKKWDAATLASKIDRGAVRVFLGTGHYRDALDAHRAQVLTEAANLAEKFTERWPDWDAMKADGIIGPFTAFGALADELRRMAAAGKDTRDGGQPPAGESTQPTQVWQVFEEDTPVVGPLAALYDTIHAARTATITRYEQMEGICPDYSWRPGEDGSWELLAGGEPVGIYMAPVPVRGDTRVQEPAPDFFQPDHTYTREHHGHRIEFLVEHVATPPGGHRPIAFGWRTEPCISGWAPEDSDDMDGWTEAGEAL